MNRVLHGTPGYVVWCIERTMPPTPSLRQALQARQRAQTHGCPHDHRIRPVLIASDGKRFRYADRQMAG